MTGPKLIGLVRVSTDKQGDSGLGLDAQEAAIDAYRRMVGGQLIKTYVEVESGMHDDVDGRPQLRAAAAHANYARARLVIAKIDRLVRSIPVMAYLKQQRVEFVACDNPHANELTIDILVAVAADEGRRISQRTRDALAAYKVGRRVSKRVRALHPNGVPPEVVEATAGKLGAAAPVPQPRRRGAQEGGAGRRGGAPAPGPRRLRPPHPDDARAPGHRPVARPDRRGPQRPGTQDPAGEALEQDPGQAGAGSRPTGMTRWQALETSRGSIGPGR